MKLKGKIQRILPIQQGTSEAGNQWQKVEFIVEETGSEHPDILCISAMNDRVQELLGFNNDDEVEVYFSCQCNVYNGRVCNSLNLFKIAKVGAPQPAPKNDDDEVEVYFSCRCNVYNGRVYNSLNLFKIAKVGAPQPAPVPGNETPLWEDPAPKNDDDPF